MADQRANVFITGQDRSKPAFDSFTRNVEGISKRVEGMQRLIAGGIAGITGVNVYRKFINESIDAQNEQAQLAAVLRSTGQAAGWTQEQLNAMAEELAGRSIFSDGDINKAQTTLLEFTGIVGKEYPEALQYAADMASRRGMQIAASAEIIGRALDSPKDGLAALSKQGFKFTDDQKKLVEQLQKTGDRAGAQRIILEALRSTYEGAAQAARDTFGGSLAALKNTIDSLMTGEGGGMTKLQGSVEKLNKTLASPETKTAFQTFVGWLADASTAAIQGASNLITFINAKNKLQLLTGTDEFGKMKSNAEGASAQLERLTSMAERYQEAINRGDNVPQNTRNLDRIRSKIADVSKEAAAASDALKGFADKAAPLPEPKATTQTAPTPQTPTPTGDGKGDKDDPTKRLLDNALKDLERYIAAEGSLLGQRNKFLEMYNGQGLLSVQNFYDAQQVALDEATANQVRAYDEQIAALRDYQAKTAKATERAEAQGKIDGLQAKRDDAMQEAGIKGLELAIKRGEAEREVLKAADDLTAQFKEMNGDLAAAAAMRFDAQFEKTALLFENNLMPGMSQMLKDLRQMTVAQAQINAMTQKFSVIQGDLQMGEERITMALERGTMGQITALLQSGELRRKALADMERELERYKDLESTVGLTDEQRQSYERLKFQIESLKGTINPLANMINASTSRAGATLFNDLISRSKSAKDAIGDFGDSVFKTINDLVSQQLGNALMKSLFGGDPNGGFGGLMSQLFAGGGNAGAAKSPGLGGLVGNAVNWFAGFFAEGGSIPAGKAGIVGEKGWELIEGPATVTPLHKLAGGRSVTQNVTYQVQGRIDRQTQTQLAQRNRRALESAGRLA